MTHLLCNWLLAGFEAFLDDVFWICTNFKSARREVGLEVAEKATKILFRVAMNSRSISCRSRVPTVSDMSQTLKSISGQCLLFVALHGPIV